MALTQQEKTSLEVKALQQLHTDPLAFLKENAITPSNATGTQARIAEYFITVQDQMVQRPGSILGNLNKHAAYRFKIGGYSTSSGGTKFQAVYIPVQPSNVAINPFPLTTAGTSLMITTQLTGCCIVMVPQGGTWAVAHLQPTNETGIALRNRLAQAGIKVYGATDYAGGRAALVGIRQGGTWNFYTQTQDASFNVTGVRKLS